jgi:hypothetical protein
VPSGAAGIQRRSDRLQCAIAKRQAGRAEPFGPVHVRARRKDVAPPLSQFDENLLVELEKSD